MGYQVQTVSCDAETPLPEPKPSPVPTRSFAAVLLTIDKVILAKGVSLFREVPDMVLVELASLLEGLAIPAHEIIVQKGAYTDCMHIITAGRVKIHDGGTVMVYQRRGETFGELAVLDPQPRLTTVTAIEDTHLLRLDQESFYLLMEDHIELAHGIMRVLSQRLRGRCSNVTDPDSFPVSV